jgi:hypothetical protein
VRETFSEALARVGLAPRMDAAYEAELADLPPPVSQDRNASGNAPD